MTKNDIIVISECISAPFDEGLKNVLFNMIVSIKKKHKAVVVTNITNDTAELDVEKLKLNKMFVNRGLKTLLSKLEPGIIFYVPEASCTFNSFLRAKVLKMMSRHSKVLMLCAQHRTYSVLQDILIKLLLKPDLLFLLSNKNERKYQDKGINVKVLPLAVDNVKFSPAALREKEKIRAEYNIPLDKVVVLHVGHIRKSRNIEILLDLQGLDNIQVVVVGSTSTEKDFIIEDELKRAGVSVINEFITDISIIYKMSDIYVFPVISNTAAIEMPLSVIEAMACNLFICTTRFGGLPDYFIEDNDFKYFNTKEDIIELIKSFKNMDRTEIRNYKKVERFTWEKLMNELMIACEKLS